MFLVSVLTTACVSTDIYSAQTGNDGATDHKDDVLPELEPSLPIWQMGPLDEFWLRIHGSSNIHARWHNPSPDHILFEAESEQAERDSVVAACMLEQGFTYLPASMFSARYVVERGPGTFIHPHTREWAEHFGFGHSTINSPGRWDEPWSFGTNINQEAHNLHRELEATMSPAYREAYLVALNGGIPSGEWVFPETRESAIELLGCRGLFDWERVQLVHFTDEFSGIRYLAIYGFDRSLRSDLRIQQIDRDWAQCMAGKGFPIWSDPVAAADSFLAESLGDSQQTAHHLDIESLQYWDWITYPDGPGQLDQRSLREREIAAATASWDCRQEVSYDEIWQLVNLELQHQFVDLNWLELEDWARAAESQRKSSLSP